jgi:hypothetical protein
VWFRDLSRNLPALPTIVTAMRVESANTNLAGQAARETSPLRQNLQVALLRKSLDAQKAEAEATLKLLEPKGRVIDIRA